MKGHSFPTRSKHYHLLWKTKVISFDLSIYINFKLLGIWEKSVCKVLSIHFCRVIILLEYVRCSPNKFALQAFAQSREMFPSEISPLLTQKFTSTQKISSVWEVYFPLVFHDIREYFPEGKTWQWSKVTQIQKEKMNRCQKCALHSHQKADEQVSTVNGLCCPRQRALPP